MWKALRQLAPFLSIAIIIAVAFFVWANGLTGDVARLENKVDNLAAQQTEIRQDIRGLRNEIRISRNEIRTSKEEVIAAIQEHRHDEEGKTVFYASP